MLCYTIHKMTQITFLDHILYRDGSSTPFSVTVSKDGCTVALLENNIDLTWDQIADVDYLAEVFGDVAVKMFKPIVELLGKIYIYKDICKEFM